MTRKKKSSRKNTGDRIIQGLTELRDTLRAGIPPEQRFTARTVEVPAPEPFDAPRVQALRARLQASQQIFARLVGVSPILVQSWEQGVRKPSPVARRLLREMERNPGHWQHMIVSVPAPRRKSA